MTQPVLPSVAGKEDRYAGPPAGAHRDAGRPGRPLAGEALAQQIQQVTDDTVELAYVDQGYTDAAAVEAAGHHGIQLEVVKHLRRGELFGLKW
jgi:hypothetical protein